MNEKEVFIIRPTGMECTEYIITIGEHLATNKRFSTKEEAEEYINPPKWDTIFALIAEMLELNEKKNRKESEEKNDLKETNNNI